MNIQAILDDWNQGLTHGQIQMKYQITRQQEYAITLCSGGLSLKAIEKRLRKITDGMTSKEINAVMRGQKTAKQT